VFFTGAGCQETAVDAMKAGVDDYVAKSRLHLVRLRAAAVRAVDEARQRHALAAAEGRYRRLVERVPVGLFQLAADGRILDANPAMGDLLGRPHDALVGTSKWALYRRPAESARWQVVMARHGVVHDFETDWVRPDGGVVRVRESARAGWAPDGARRWDGAVEALDAHPHRPHGRFASEFLAHVSDELRTHLHTAAGMAQLALECPLADEPRGYVERVEAAVRSLQPLLDDLVDPARTAAGRMALQQTPFDLRSAVHDALRTLGAGAAERGLALVCHVPDGTLARVMGDERRFREVLVQLVGDALELRPSGPIAVTVAADGAGVRLAVSDAGTAPSRDGVAFPPVAAGGSPQPEPGRTVTLSLSGNGTAPRLVASPGF
jgi:PAS domain S-box-containing protein